MYSVLIKNYGNLDIFLILSASPNYVASNKNDFATEPPSNMLLLYCIQLSKKHTSTLHDHPACQMLKNMIHYILKFDIIENRKLSHKTN